MGGFMKPSISINQTKFLIFATFLIAASSACAPAVPINIAVETVAEESTDDAIDADESDEGSSSDRTIYPSATGVVSIASSNRHSCALTNVGTVRCWGYNGSGQLGDGTGIVSAKAVYAKGVLNATAIAAGYNHTCAVVEGGQVKCFGNNDQGQLGDATTKESWTSVWVADATGDGNLRNVTQIAAGSAHSCALSDGKVYCWGANSKGQLGDGTVSRRTLPVLVKAPGGSAPLTGVDSISAGLNHSCAVAGSVAYCWGANNDGQLGDGTQNVSARAIVPTGLSGHVKSLSAGAYHSCALLTTGRVKCWGRNINGQLGDNTLDQRLVPTYVRDPQGTTSVSTWETIFDFGDAYLPQLRYATAISSGFAHTCAVVSGLIRCWGSNGSLQAGKPESVERVAYPTPVAGLSGTINGLASGYGHSCALVGSKAWCWGSNEDAQLGADAGQASSSPVQVEGLPAKLKDVVNVDNGVLSQ